MMVVQVGCNFGNMYGKHCNYPMIYTFQAYRELSFTKK